MVLQKQKKKAPRPIALTVRLSKECVTQLRVLAKEHNMSQADVVEELIFAEYKSKGRDR